MQQSHGLLAIAKLLVPNSQDRDETFNLQDRDETHTFQKTSRDQLETKTFKTETTSLKITIRQLAYCLVQTAFEIEGKVLYKYRFETKSALNEVIV